MSDSVDQMTDSVKQEATEAVVEVSETSRDRLAHFYIDDEELSRQKLAQVLHSYFKCHIFIDFVSNSLNLCQKLF